MNVKITALRVGKVFLKALYAFMKLRPTKKKISIISRQSDRPTVDIALLVDYFEKNHPDLDVKVMCRKLGSKGSFSYGMHILDQMWNMADSAVLLLDSYCIPASILDHKRSLSIIQMWHSMAAIKKFGFQNTGMPGGRPVEIAEVLCMHRNYDGIICPSSATGRYFCEAFGYDGSVLLSMALPRVDLITDPRQTGRNIREEHGIDPGKEVLLYVPTFRKNGQLSLDGIVECIDREKFVLVVSPHPLDESRCLDTARGYENGSLIVDGKRPFWQWLDACDRVITDYSAASLEAALAGKPLYFYVYDIEEYLRDEGLNIDPREEMPEITATDVESLASLLEGGYPEEILKRFRDRYFEVDDRGCTAALGEYLYGMAEKNN